jgi:hypothetical protein
MWTFNPWAARIDKAWWPMDRCPWGSETLRLWDRQTGREHTWWHPWGSADRGSICVHLDVSSCPMCEQSKDTGPSPAYGKPHWGH